MAPRKLKQVKLAELVPTEAELAEARRVIDEAENRVHAQKAILAYVFDRLG